MAADLEALTARLLDAAKAAGAEAADAIAVAGDSLSIEVRNGALEQAERAEGIDLGLRVLIGRRQACVSSSDIRAETIAAMAERAVAMAREAPEDPWCGLAGAGGAGARLGPGGARSRRPRADARRRRSCRRRRSRPRRRRWRCPGVSKMDAAGAGWSSSRDPSRRHQRLLRRLRPHRALAAGGGDLRRGHGDGARLRLREPRAPRRPARPGRGRPAGRRADGGARRRRQAADRRLSGALRRAGGLRADRPSGAGDQRHRDRPRRELAQGRAGRAGAAGRASTSSRTRCGRGSAARGRSTARGCRSRGGRWSRTACCRAGRSTSRPGGSSGCRAPATRRAAPRRRRARPPATWR